MPSLQFFTISAQLNVRLLATRLSTRADLRACTPIPGKALRERGGLLTVPLSFNTSKAGRSGVF
jgi:hypothetical protein